MAAGPSPTRVRPLLVYDGDCGFCAYWARYWKRLTGEAVDYQPYQSVAADHPAIPVADFQHAVQYLTADGRRASAAEASFLSLSHAPGKGIWLALYRNVPGFAAVAEWAYALIARHRPLGYRISLLLWGGNFEPPRHELVAFVLLRGLGLIYLAAFVSFGVQARGLIGSHGIVPLTELVDGLSRTLGPERYWLMPMVFWWSASDFTIEAVCWTGALAALLLTLNLLPRASLLLLYVLYLSLLYGGQVFMTYQWDVYLLETGFLALLLSFATGTGIWLLRWLLFRFTFMSGVVKLASGDPNWWNLSALSYHFVTQPLPTPLAWYAAQLSPQVLKFATGATFFIELALPVLIFCPRRLRFLAAGGMLLLQAGILITGNYNWFNLQTMLLCLVLFDDAAVRRLVPQRLLARLALLRPESRRPRTAGRVLLGTLALVIVFSSLVQMQTRFGGHASALTRAVARLVEPFRIVSGYGLFAVMTTQRDEIIVEGSDDGTNWREYEFRYKPGSVLRRPPWNIPHQPRLDWQMWFAALDDPRRLPWFERFLQRLLENEPTVTALLEQNPFVDKPPLYVRALYYDYTYASAADKAHGRWWNRRLLGLYFPAVRLKGE